MQTCQTHAIDHSDIEDCPACRAAVAMAIVDGAPKADTSRARTIAAEYRLKDIACWAEMKRLRTDDPHVAVKWSTESGKWAGRADELEMKILEIEHEQWLVEQKRSIGN